MSLRIRLLWVPFQKPPLLLERATERRCWNDVADETTGF